MWWPPRDDWDDYAFAYHRATYLLSGRHVLPLIGPDSRPLPKNWRDAQVLAIYGRPVPPTETKIMWKGKGIGPLAMFAVMRVLALTFAGAKESTYAEARPHL